MVGQIRGVCVLVFVARPNSEGFLFVDVGLPHTHGDGEDGNVHHDEIADLDRGVEVGNVDDGETGGTRCGGLEETCEEAEAAWKGSNSWIV